MQIKDENFSLRINQQGVRKMMDSLETEIMEAFWSADRPAITCKDVYRIIREQRDICYGTVMTTISKLVDKDLLAIVDIVGLSNCYAPTCTKAELIEATIGHVIEVLFRDFPMESVKSLAAYSRAQTNERLLKL